MQFKKYNKTVKKTNLVWDPLVWVQSKIFLLPRMLIEYRNFGLYADYPPPPSNVKMFKLNKYVYK